MSKNHPNLVSNLLIIFFFGISVNALAFGGEPYFQRVAPISKDCALIYGTRGLGGEDFFIKQCRRTWKLSSTFNLGFINEIQFVSSTDAWGIVGKSLVRFHFDFSGGKVRWSEVKPDSSDTEFVSAYFTDAKNGLVCGRNGSIFSTYDGGVTWQKVEIGSAYELIKIQSANDGSLIVHWAKPFKGLTRYGYLISVDRGRTWSERTLPEGETFGAVFVSFARHGCGIVGRDRLLCTFDGTNWSSLYLESENRNSLWFLNSRIGWSVGSSIMRTSNGGRSWKYALLDPDSTSRAYQGLFLKDVVFLDSKIGWAWGPTSVYRTFDGGLNWQRVSDKWNKELAAY